MENAKREGVSERVEVKTGDMRKMPFANASFDVIVSRAAIHNLYSVNDRATAVREIARVLKPGGMALIDDIRHYQEYGAVFTDNGCDVRRISSAAVSMFWTILTFGSLRPATLLVPCGFAMLILLAWACALGVSPIAPRARDVRRFAGYFLSFWYFLTPVIYPIDKIPSGWQFLASLNPVTAPIELVKNGLLGVGDVTSLGLATYFGALIVVGSLGLRVFLRAERRDMASY